jgi:uncharacterized protein YqgV (UPF0045/DUF77 family)
MKQSSDTREKKIEVKLGSRSLIIEQCQLDELIEAITEMNNLAATGKALMSVGSA